MSTRRHGQLQRQFEHNTDLYNTVATWRDTVPLRDAEKAQAHAYNEGGICTAAHQGDLLLLLRDKRSHEAAKFRFIFSVVYFHLLAAV